MNKGSRFWEIDALRGAAVIMFLASNFVTDLQYFTNYSSYETFWWAFARVTAFIFVFLVGFCLTISYSRVKHKKNIFKKYFVRGSYIFGLGLIITAVTLIFLQQDFIRFGVLHLIGLSIILAYPFLKLSQAKLSKTLWIFLIGLAVILGGELIKGISASSNWLLWLGLTTSNFSSIDYFPLLPWFGVILIGIAFGHLLYPNGMRGVYTSRITDRTQKIVKPFCFLGRHSLLIYFIHQPILLGLLWVFIL